MPLARNRRHQRAVDYWPGFVDALSTLLIAIMFILTVFVVGQFILSREISGRDEVLTRLNSQINELTQLLALEKGRAGERHHAVADEGVPFRTIAETIGRKLGLPVKAVAPDEARESLGWMAPFAQFDVPTSSALTRQRLGWVPTGPSLLDDLAEGTYFD